MSNPIKEDSLVINSDQQNIAKVERLIDVLSKEFKLDDEIYGKLLLTVVEGANNAIVHGNKCDVSKQVTLHYVVDNESIMFEISDMGDGFDPASIPDPTAPENIERDCGRGLYLMKHLSDEITFDDNGRRVIIKFQLQ